VTRRNIIIIKVVFTILTLVIVGTFTDDNSLMAENHKVLSNMTVGQKLIEYKLKVEKVYNHNRTAYTQGLFFNQGVLYESTGQYGESSFRKVDLETGKVLNFKSFDSKYFLEGSCVMDGRLYILTWRAGLVFVYDLDSMNLLGQLPNQKEGWGLTTDGKQLITSNGTDKIYFVDPMSFISKREIKVSMNGKPVSYLNELEYIDGKIWANVYLQDYIVVINPYTGIVEAKVDCRNLLPDSLKNSYTDVLNGIAWDSQTGCLYLSGKYWPRLYKVSLIRK